MGAVINLSIAARFFQCFICISLFLAVDRSIYDSLYTICQGPLFFVYLLNPLLCSLTRLSKLFVQPT